METIRTKLSRKRRTLVFRMWIGGLIFFVGLIATTVSQWLWILCMGGAFLLLSANYLLSYKMPCPSCGRNLGRVISSPFRSGGLKWNLGVPDQIKVCKFCGVSLDKEIED
jgi:hypothetical protein